MNGNDRAPGTSGTGPAWAVLAVVFGTMALFSLAWVGGTLAVAVVGGGWHAPAYSGRTLGLLLRGEPSRVWSDHGTAATVGIIIVLVLAVAAATAAGVMLRARFARPSGLAGRHQMEPLAHAALVKRARQLRPSLANADTISPDDAGLLLGDLSPRGPELRASWEDVVIAIMAPRSGKTTALAVPAILRAPGMALVTTNRADVYLTTASARSEVGRIWLIDPQNITHSTRGLWWDMLEIARTIEGADRLAGHFLNATSNPQTKDFFAEAAKSTLTALFHAAAVSGGTVADVLAWLSTPGERTPIDALREAGQHPYADQLASTATVAVETRDGVYATARVAVASLLNPQVLAWVTRDPAVPQFRPSDAVDSRDTVYLLSKDGGGSVSGLIAAMADSVFLAGMDLAERRGGRVDPPVLAVLDEAANICKIEDLPNLYSHLGGRGVIPITILQSYRQGVRAWGDVGMDALWSAATVKLLGAGLDDPDFADKISRLIGDHRVTEYSTSHSASGRSTSISSRRERVMDAADVRAMPKGTGLLLATGMRIAPIRFRPWFREPGADVITAQEAKAKAALTDRATAAGAAIAAAPPPGLGVHPYPQDPSEASP